MSEPYLAGFQKMHDLFERMQTAIGLVGGGKEELERDSTQKAIRQLLEHGTVPDLEPPLYFTIARGKVARTLEVIPGAVLVDVDAAGRILGVEVYSSHVEPSGD